MPQPTPRKRANESAAKPKVVALAPIPAPSAVVKNGHPAGAPHELDIAEKIKELVRLAQEQGYLTHGDVNEQLPEGVVSPEELDEAYTKLRSLEIDIVDQAEVDRVKQPEPEEEEEKHRPRHPR